MMRMLWLVLLVPIALAFGMLYQWLGAIKDKKRFLGLGTLVDVGNGRRMYLSQTGTGGPSVIFESGIAATSQNWAQLQESVSAFAHTVTYDRGGLGWSSASPTARTPSNIVPELRTLLQEAGIPAPYVLVGHSFGGLVVRHFAAEHPEEVLGVVLIDPMRPEAWPPINEAQRATLDRGVRLSGWAVPIARVGLARLATTSLFCRTGKSARFFSGLAGDGGQHVLDRLTCEVNKMPPWTRPIVAAHWSSPKFYRGLAAHVRAVPATVCEMRDAKPVNGIPVQMLLAADAEPLSSQALRAVGSEAEQTVAANCGHWIHLDNHDLVLTAIRDMVEQVRAQMEDVEAFDKQPSIV